MCAIILWTLYLNVTYFKEINKHLTPPNYSYWNLWNTVFILFISGFIIFDEIIKEDKIKDPKIVKITIGFILFLMFIITGIQHTILQNFTVDG